MPRGRCSRRNAARAAFALATVIALTRRGRADEAAVLRIGGTGAALGSMAMLGRALAGSGGSDCRVVPSLGSTGGLKALAAGKLDLAVSSRDLKPEERAAGLVIRQYASTPFMLVTSRAAGPDALTLDELTRMVGGEVAVWPDGKLVRLVLRPPTESDTIQLAAFHPKMPAALDAARKRPGIMEADTDQAAADALEELAGSLGTSTLSLVTSEHRALRAFTLEGAAPALEGRANLDYPHRKRLYLAWRPNPSAAARAFMSFLDDPRGREVLAASGHIVDAG